MYTWRYKIPDTGITVQVDLTDSDGYRMVKHIPDDLTDPTGDLGKLRRILESWSESFPVDGKLQVDGKQVVVVVDGEGTPLAVATTVATAEAWADQHEREGDTYTLIPVSVVWSAGRNTRAG